MSKIDLQNMYRICRIIHNGCLTKPYYIENQCGPSTCVLAVVNIDTILIEDHVYRDDKLELAQTRDKMEPVKLDVLDNLHDKKFDLVDGHHRIATCKKRKYTYVWSIIFTTMEDAKRLYDNDDVIPVIEIKYKDNYDSFDKKCKKVIDECNNIIESYDIRVQQKLLNQSSICNML